MNVLELFAKIVVDRSEFDKGLKDAESSASSFGGKVKSALGTAMKVGAAAIGTATTAVTGFGLASVKTGMEFDKSMSQVAATMGTTTDQIGRLRDFAQEMGRTTAFSATQAAEALNYMALAGYDADKSMSMLPNVLNLAAAGSMDLARASDMVTDAQSALGLTMEETTKMVDQMAKASATGNTSVSQLGEAILQIGGTAKDMKGGTEELSAVLTALADNGIKGAEGGTKLRNVIMSLSSPTDKAKAALDKLNVSLYDDSGEMRALNEVMGDLNREMDGMSTEDRKNLLNDVFNKQDLKAVEALLGTSTERWDELYKSIQNADGAAEDMAKTQLDNLAGDVTLLKSAFEGLQIAISDGATGPLREFVQLATRGVSDLTTAFSKFDATPYLDETGKMTTAAYEAQKAFEKNREAAINDVFAAITDGIGMIVDMVPTMAELGIKLLKAIGQGLMDNLHVILFAAGDIIEYIMNGLLEATEGHNSTLMEILNTIAGVFEENYMTLIDIGMQILNNIIQGIIEGLPDLIYYAQEILLHIADAIIENYPILVESAWGMLKTLAEGLAEALPELIPKAVEMIMTIVTSLIENVDLLVDAAIALVMGLANGIIEALPVLIEKMPELIVALVTAIIENLPQIIAAAIQIVIALATGIVQAIPHAVTAMLNLFELLFTTIKNKLPEWLQSGKDLIKKMGEGILALKSAPKQAMVDVLIAIRDKVKEWFGQAKTWGADMVSNFVDGIKSRIGDAINAAKELGQSIKDYIGFSEPKYGPLSNFHTFAPDMVDLFAKGIYDSENVLIKAVSDVFDIGSYMTTPTFTPAVAGAYGTEGIVAGGYNQTIIINSPTQLSPSEVARQTRNATRDMVLELRGK